MKKTLMILLTSLACTGILFAGVENPKGINVAFDIPTLTSSLSSTNVMFTTNAITSTGVDFSNYKDFDAFIDQKATNITLQLERTGADLYGISALSSLYISYQVYSNQVVDIEIKPNGPLLDDTGKKINWQVYPVADGKPVEGLVAGSILRNTGETEYSTNASFVVFTSNPEAWGISGSKELQIKTQPLIADDVGSFHSTLSAIIKPK